MKYDLSNITAIAEAVELAKDKANNEPNQNSYNAAWLHGYAEALADILKLLEKK